MRAVENPLRTAKTVRLAQLEHAYAAWSAGERLVHNLLVGIADDEVLEVDEGRQVDRVAADGDLERDERRVRVGRQTNEELEIERRADRQRAETEGERRQDGIDGHVVVVFAPLC